MHFALFTTYATSEAEYNICEKETKLLKRAWKESRMPSHFQLPKLQRLANWNKVVLESTQEQLKAWKEYKMMHFW